MEPLLENTKIYVRGLPMESTDNALSEYFEKYGRVVKATVAMDRVTGKPKDFGFVWFEDEDSAKAAIGDVEEHVILGTKVEVKEAIRRERSPIQGIERENCLNCERIRALWQSKKIFVGGLPSDLTEEEFESFFESFGKTTDVVIIVDRESRKSRGFGFVTYESEESARAVLRTSRYVIHGKEVEVKVAIPKEMAKEVEVKVEIPKEMANTTEHPNVHSQRHPSAGANGYHHDSNFRPMGGLPSANSAPIYLYAVVTTSPAYAYGTAAPTPAYANSMVNGFHTYNGYARTVSNRYNVTPRPFSEIGISKPPGINGENIAGSSSASCAEDPSPSNRYNVAPRPFTKIRISKPPGINGENSAGLSAEGPSPASEDSNLNGCPSPSVIDDGKDQASSSKNGQNDS